MTTEYIETFKKVFSHMTGLEKDRKAFRKKLFELSYKQTLHAPEERVIESRNFLTGWHPVYAVSDTDTVNFPVLDDEAQQLEKTIREKEELADMVTETMKDSRKEDILLILPALRPVFKETDEMRRRGEFPESAEWRALKKEIDSLLSG